MKNVTQIDSLTWLQQLCSPALLSYGQPLTEVSKEIILLTETNQTSVAAIKADFLIAKSMAKA